MSSTAVSCVAAPAMGLSCDAPVPLPAAGLKLKAFVVGSVAAGFPSPAEDHGAKRIDLIERLITHPQATYVMRVRGLSMVDRAIKPRSGQIVVAVVDGEFTVNYLWMRVGRFTANGWAGSP